MIPGKFRNNRWKYIALAELIVIIGLLAYIYSQQYTSFQPKGFFPDKVNKKYGRCRPAQPADTNYVKVSVSLKGKMLAISEFEWNDTNYVSRPGCFRPNADQSEYTMNNYIYRATNDTLVPFYTKIRTRSNDNDYEFSIKVFNHRNELIGKYPEGSESLKGKIDFIGIPAILMENVKLKN